MRLLIVCSMLAALGLSQAGCAARVATGAVVGTAVVAKKTVKATRKVTVRTGRGVGRVFRRRGND